MKVIRTKKKAKKKKAKKKAMPLIEKVEKIINELKNEYNLEAIAMGYKHNRRTYTSVRGDSTDVTSIGAYINNHINNLINNNG